MKEPYIWNCFAKGIPATGLGLGFLCSKPISQLLLTLIFAINSLSSTLVSFNNDTSFWLVGWLSWRFLVFSCKKAFFFFSILIAQVIWKANYVFLTQGIFIWSLVFRTVIQCPVIIKFTDTFSSKITILSSEISI